MRAVRWARVIGLLGCLAAAPGFAANGVRAERQGMLEYILTKAPSATVATARAHCLAGAEPASIAQARGLGFSVLPDPADYCVAVLTRSARDGQTTPLRDARAQDGTSASAIDNGFMAAYAKGEAIPPGLPMMATLRPVAARCLALRESNTDLCWSVGYAYGVRAFHGEIVAVP